MDLSICRSYFACRLGPQAPASCQPGDRLYALPRETFGRSISQFEGVQEALWNPFAGYTWMMAPAACFLARRYGLA